ncbi:adenylate/guanylate cyclase domain-containing protein [Stappia sp. ES.058]|uniref:adenylate/guanylate cyclase domain-containing protein n=1 Tax=Stappia sp. ES.058 TaxID=1881061 RepID=UPI00087BE29E|nr:adenylate/guanylate cyclase domain-containing protein [Stappia sp. ES.058]SDT99668.1 adenylate cyclase [Stappia sp. ES.058]
MDKGKAVVPVPHPGGLVGYILRGGPRQDGIPERVRAEIRMREDSAERLIGWAQLAMVVFFAALYSLAPRAEGADGFNFVPLALAAYFLFTVLRVGLSYRFSLPAWYLVVSIMVDVALLCALIFSFHIQYGQHPTFFLKAPTLMYLFIFISLRALRFDPRFVLITGLVGVVGWLALVAYAVTADMGEMRITRNYVEYLTSNAILIGAELDKTIIILGVTLFLSVALYRGRQVLFDSVRDHAAAEDLKRFFAPEVAHTITDAEEALTAGRGDVRNVAVMFVDIRGFTRTAASLSPATVMQVLACYQEDVLALISVHGGRVDKFLGDGILATFGAVEASETAAADALRAASGLTGAVDRLAPRAIACGWPETLRVGGAVTYGAVTVGVVGAGNRLEFTVIGDAVNRAAKLEDANKAQETRVLTDMETLAAARLQGYQELPLDLRRAQGVAGLAQPVDLVVLA